HLRPHPRPHLRPAPASDDMVHGRREDAREMAEGTTMTTFRTRFGVVSMAAAALSLAAIAALGAQQDERQRALDDRIDRIYGAREYDVPRFGPARWLPDGTAYTTLEAPPTGKPE